VNGDSNAFPVHIEESIMNRESVIALPNAVPNAASEATDDRAALTGTEVNAWAERCVTAAERLAELNRQAIQTSIEEQRAIALEALDERSLLGAWRLQASYSLTGTAKAAAYFRHVGEIVLTAYADAVNDTESHLNRVFWDMTNTLDGAASAARSSVLAVESTASEAARSINESVQIVDAEGKAVSRRAE
jgi:phasin family protein